MKKMLGEHVKNSKNTTFIGNYNNSAKKACVDGHPPSAGIKSPLLVAYFASSFFSCYTASLPAGQSVTQ